MMLHADDAARPRPWRASSSATIEDAARAAADPSQGLTITSRYVYDEQHAVVNRLAGCF
jgi:hypothetical protein